ncbi:MAG: hypothetical protein AB7N76_32150 [Planctomycetota bacterium]
MSLDRIRRALGLERPEDPERPAPPALHEDPDLPRRLARVGWAFLLLGTALLALWRLGR